MPMVTVACSVTAGHLLGAKCTALSTFKLFTTIAFSETKERGTPCIQFILQFTETSGLF